MAEAAVQGGVVVTIAQLLQQQQAQLAPGGQFTQYEVRLSEHPARKCLEFESTGTPI